MSTEPIADVSPAKITAAAICAAMRKLYAQPEWSIMFEVRDAAGFNARVSADAVAMSLWPSRGLELHGFEIKVSRTDWRREAAKPEKAETIAKYCDRWWVVAPPGVVPVEELPPTWGLRTWDGRRWAIVKDAAKTEAAPLSRNFLAALLKRSQQVGDAEIDALVTQRDETRKADFQKRVDEQVKYRTRDLQKLKDGVDAFQKASGVSLEHEWRAGEIGAAVKLVQDLGVVDLYGGAASLLKSHEMSAERIREALAVFSASRTSENAS